MPISLFANAIYPYRLTQSTVHSNHNLLKHLFFESHTSAKNKFNKSNAYLLYLLMIAASDQSYPCLNLVYYVLMRDPSAMLHFRSCQERLLEGSVPAEREKRYRKPPFTPDDF